MVCPCHVFINLLLRLPVGAAQEVCRVLTPRQQAEIYWQAQSAWYVTLICSQFWHIWVCKTRVVSAIHQHVQCHGGCQSCCCRAASYSCMLGGCCKHNRPGHRACWMLSLGWLFYACAAGVPLHPWHLPQPCDTLRRLRQCGRHGGCGVRTLPAGMFGAGISACACCVVTCLCCKEHVCLMACAGMLTNSIIRQGDLAQLLEQPALHCLLLPLCRVSLAPGT